MIISDLNYLQTAEETIEGGRGRKFNFKKDVDIDVKVKVDIKKDVDSKVDIKGNLADAEALAEAYGDNSLSETVTTTYAQDDYTEAYSSSISAVD